VLTIRDLPRPVTPPGLKERVLLRVQEEGTDTSTDDTDAPASDSTT
jgi:hypothetical protein